MCLNTLIREHPSGKWSLYNGQKYTGQFCGFEITLCQSCVWLIHWSRHACHVCGWYTDQGTPVMCVADTLIKARLSCVWLIHWSRHACHVCGWYTDQGTPVMRVADKLIKARQSCVWLIHWSDQDTLIKSGPILPVILSTAEDLSRLVLLLQN